MTGGSHSSAKGRAYGCLAYHKRGTSVCGNGLKLPITLIDDAVLKTLAGDVFRPAVIEAVLDGVLEAMNPDTIASEIHTCVRNCRPSNASSTDEARSPRPSTASRSAHSTAHVYA